MSPTPTIARQHARQNEQTRELKEHQGRHAGKGCDGGHYLRRRRCMSGRALWSPPPPSLHKPAPMRAASTPGVVVWRRPKLLADAGAAGLTPRAPDLAVLTKALHTQALGSCARHMRCTPLQIQSTPPPTNQDRSTTAAVVEGGHAWGHDKCRRRPRRLPLEEGEM